MALIPGFGLLQWAVNVGGQFSSTWVHQMDLSAEAFFTPGIEHLLVDRQTPLMIWFLEAATGFGFIALMVSYLPVLYTHFSQRDARLVQLDARAGTPATAGTALCRFALAGDGKTSELITWLAEWEHWASNLVESNSAYPMLAFYRSQHRDQSWLATLADILDLSTFLISAGEHETLLPAAGAFHASRRVLEEICSSLAIPPDRHLMSSRVCRDRWLNFWRGLSPTPWSSLHSAAEATPLDALVATYEPHLQALSRYLLLPLPRLISSGEQEMTTEPNEIRRRLVERLVKP